MAARGECVAGFVGDVGVHDGDGDEPGAFVEDLDAQAGGDFADAGVDEGAGGDGAAAEGEVGGCCGEEVGEQVGDEVVLGNALEEEGEGVGFVLLEGEVAVYGAGHVA